MQDKKTVKKHNQRPMLGQTTPLAGFMAKSMNRISKIVNSIHVC